MNNKFLKIFSDSIYRIREYFIFKFNYIEPNIDTRLISMVSNAKLNLVNEILNLRKGCSS